MERNTLVDKLKGYACFLVLFGHVIMGMRNAGVNMPEFFFGLEKFIWSFHVSLFLFLSGVVYRITGEWKSKKTKSAFIIHKLINLGVPYIVFSVVYILINSLSGQANTQSSMQDILNIWKMPVAQYWFLYALFFLFCIWTILSLILKNWQTTLIVALSGYIVPALGGSFGSFDVVVYSALAFGLGTCITDITRFAKTSVRNKLMVIIAHILTGVIVIRVGWIEQPFVKEIMMLMGIYSSILFISLLENIKPVAAFWDFMNKYSFQTYLLHTIFTAGIRIVLLRMGIAQWWLHILAGCIGGIVFSTLAAVISNKLKLTDILFFPTKTYKKIFVKTQ